MFSSTETAVQLKMAMRKGVIELSALNFERVGNEQKLDHAFPKIDLEVPYAKFFEDHLFRNLPCIIGNFITADWKSRYDWVIDGKPNLPLLRKSYGNAVVPVADCKEMHYNVQKKTDTALIEFLNYWEKCIKKDIDMNEISLYMKDWHFMRDFPGSDIYQVPQYFASDWLNEYLTTGQHEINDDYRFVYMGPAGSWTPLHADVFMSFSWSVNICGRKRWLLFPPGQEDKLRNKFHQLAFDVESLEMFDESLFPHYSQLETSYEVIQEAGEAMFVPSGWHHQVWNLEDTISINHNWVNGCNINVMWTSLQFNLDAVKKEVEDCKDMDGWEEHCQIMLRATFGMNYIDFYNFLHFIGKRRIDFLVSNISLVHFSSWTLGKKHVIFDLQQLLDVLKSLLIENKDIKNLDSLKNLQESPELFICEIENILQQML